MSETDASLPDIPDPHAEYRSGSTEPWTVDVLCALVRAKKPHILIETGTFLGMTTRALHAAMQSYAAEHGSLLTSIESDLDLAKAAGAQVRGWAGYAGVGVQIIHGDALDSLKGLPVGGVDFAFIDDDHTDRHVRMEIMTLMPKMRPGGIIAMHDVVGPFGLDRVCREFGGVVLEFARLHVAGGLGLIGIP